MFVGISSTLSSFRIHNKNPINLFLRDNSSVVMDMSLISAYGKNVMQHATEEESSSFIMIVKACARWDSLNFKEKDEWIKLAKEIVTKWANRALVPDGHTPKEARSLMDTVTKESTSKDELPIVNEIKSRSNKLNESHRSYKLRWQRIMLLITEINNLQDSEKDSHFTNLLEKVKEHEEFYSKISDKDKAASEVAAEMIRQL